MRDRCKNLVSFSLNFTCISLQDTVLEKKCIVFLLITNSIKILVAMRDRCEKLVFSLSFTYNSPKGTMSAKKCLVFLLITNRKKGFDGDARPL